MKKHIIALASTLLLCSGSYSQNTQPEKKPKAYMVADAHLDTQWNWDVQTTIKQYVWNTISQNLLLQKQYPDYIFNFEGGVKYAWMKEYYSAQYEEIYPGRTLAREWCQLGSQRCFGAFNRICDS